MGPHEHPKIWWYFLCLLRTSTCIFVSAMKWMGCMQESCSYGWCSYHRMHAQLPATASNTTGSIPAFAAEQSGVSPCTCKEGVGCGFIQYLLPTQQVTVRLLSDNSKLTRKFPATLTVGLLSPNWKLLSKTSCISFCLYCFPLEKKILIPLLNVKNKHRLPSHVIYSSPHVSHFRWDLETLETFQTRTCTCTSLFHSGLTALQRLSKRN